MRDGTESAQQPESVGFLSEFVHLTVGDAESIQGAHGERRADQGAVEHTAGVRAAIADPRGDLVAGRDQILQRGVKEGRD